MMLHADTPFDKIDHQRYKQLQRVLKTLSSSLFENQAALLLNQTLSNITKTSIQQATILFHDVTSSVTDVFNQIQINLVNGLWQGCAMSTWFLFKTYTDMRVMTVVWCIVGYREKIAKMNDRDEGAWVASVGLTMLGVPATNTAYGERAPLQPPLVHAMQTISCVHFALLIK